MISFQKIIDISFNVDVGDIFFADLPPSNKLIGQRPVIVLKVFPQENRVLIAPLTTSASLANKKGSVMLKSSTIHGLKRDANVLLSHRLLAILISFS